MVRLNIVLYVQGDVLGMKTKEESIMHHSAHAGSRTRVTSMGGLYDAATLHALCHSITDRLL